MFIKTDSPLFKLAMRVPVSWNLIRMSYVRVGDDCTTYAWIELGGYK
jgi:hypothetical protein